MNKKIVDINGLLLGQSPTTCNESYLMKISDSQVAIPKDIGHGSSYGFTFPEFGLLQISDITFLERTQFTNGSGPLCGAFLVLEGEVELEIEGYGKVAARSQQANLFFIGQNQCHCSYPKGRSRIVNFSIEQKLMEQLAAEYPACPIVFQSNRSLTITSALWHMPMNTKLNQLVTELFECRLPKTSAKLLIQAKLMELLTSLFDLYNKRLQTWPNIKAVDIAAIFNAAATIEQQMHNPPSLIQLARQVGINDHKLKKLFKCIFGCTVFEYLHQKRMDKAIVLLQESSLDITEIAQSIGFKHAGHFSTKFKTFTGHLPSKYKRQSSLI